MQTKDINKCLKFFVKNTPGFLNTKKTLKKLA